MKTRSIIRSALVAIVAVGAVVGVTAPAYADDNVAQARIATHGLNLGDAADRHLAEQRIKAGARQVCNSGEGGELIQTLADRRCYRDAVKNGNAQLARIEVLNRTAFAVLVLPTGSVLTR